MSSHLSAEIVIPFVIHIVDEDSQVRAALSYLLAGYGYKTEIYASADELLSQRRAGDGCIVFDSDMPGIGPLAFLAELQDLGWPIPVIMMGKGASLSAALETLRRGAFDFLQKPYQDSDLIASVERALDRSRDFGLQRERKNSARSRIAQLSSRKRQVLQGLLAGMSNKLVARRLALSPRTVELYRATLMEELEVGGLAQALRLAIDAELTPLSETTPNELPPEEIDEAGELSQDQVAAPASRSNAGVPLPPPIEILEGTTDCVFLVDADWNFAYLNVNARQSMSGGQDLIGTGLWERFPLAASTRAWDELHKAAADRRPTRFEFYEPDMRAWLDVSVRPYSAGLQVCFRNISHERRSSAQLKLSEETLLHVLEAAGDGAWDWNIQTGEVAMSEGFLARLGYERDAFSWDFDSFIHLVHPDDMATLTRCLQQHLEGTTSSFRCEYRLRRAEGGWLWNLDRGRVVARDPVTALPLRMVGTASDISDIKAAQQSAEEAFKRLELAQANAGMGLWDLDLNSLVVRFCERSRAMHGLGSDGPIELTQDDWSGTVHEADREQVVATLKAYIDTAEAYRIRYRTVAADGTVRWILGMGKAVYSRDGRPERFVGFNLEITALSALIDDVEGEMAQRITEIFKPGDITEHADANAAS